MGDKENYRMKHIFIFYQKSLDAAYGVGTYIRQLIECFKNKKNTHLHIIELQSEEKEIKIIESVNYNFLCFPNVQYNHKPSLYYRSIWHILKMYIQKLEFTDLIFHFNYFQEYLLLKHIKNKYPSSKVIFTIHYLNWCFSLKGNTSHFKRIVHSEKSYIHNNNEMMIFEYYEEEKRIFHMVDHLICLSKYIKKLLIDVYLVPDERISLIYNGLKDEFVPISNKEKCTIRGNLFFGEQTKLILFVGRLDEIKGVDILIKAFKKVALKDQKAHLVIIGGGDNTPYLAESKGFWHRITFTGRLDKDELYKFYQIADVGVMPSTHEQCSYVAIEMMMFNLPMVISTTTGLKEMIPDPDSQIEAVEEIDSVTISPDILAEKILLKLENKQNISLRNRYLSEYTLHKMFGLINEVYKNVKESGIK